MIIYKYGNVLISEKKVQKYLDKLGITKEDLQIFKDTNKTEVYKYPLERRVNATTTLCAYTEKQMEWLLKNSKYAK